MKQRRNGNGKAKGGRVLHLMMSELREMVDSTVTVEGLELQEV